MIKPVDLRPDHVKVVHSVLSANLSCTVSVRVFGSRALWTSKTHSDLDLALKSDKKLSLSVMASLKEAFSESELPFKVDIVDWNSVPPHFQSVIDSTASPLSIPLGEVSKFLSGGTPSKKQARYWQGSIPWLSPKDMASWQGKTELHVTQEGLKRGTRLAPADAIFLAVRGMSLHKEIRIVFPETEMAFNQDVKAIVSDGTITSIYLYYALLAIKPILQSTVESSGHGTGTLPTYRLEKLLIPLFSRSTEEKIAQLLKSIDQKLVLNQRMNRTLEASARALFRDWFVDFGPTKAKMAGDAPYLAPELWSLFPERLEANGLPAGWLTEELGKHIIAERGLSYKGSGLTDRENGRALYNLNSIYEGGGLKESGIKWYDGLHKEKHRVEPGDLLMANTEQGFDHLLIGFSAIVSRSLADGIFSHHLYKITPKSTSHLTRHWLHYAFSSSPIGERIRRFSNGTTVNMLPKDALSIPELTIPSKKLVLVFDDIASQISSKQEQADSENHTLAQTRDLLLPKLMSGEIRVGDAEQAVSKAV